jgi:murein L,D-transpeptidase YcbB/YkuD
LRQAYTLKVDGTCEQLPAFDSTIDHVDFEPSYTFPQAIAARYILPVLQSKPESLDPSLTIYAGSAFQGVASVDWKSYSEANFPFTVMQSPGKTNVIGEFQFPLKDDASVSIHGRPALDPHLPMPRNLWPACVALSGGGDAVASLMSEAGVGPPAAGDTAENSRRINLAAPIPVIFLYASVWLDPSGDVVFGPDPLGRDLPLFRKLTATPSS